MKNIFILSALMTALLSSSVIALEKRINGGISIWNEYNSGFVSILQVVPNSLSYGIDAGIFNFGEKGTTSHSYYGNLYIQNELYTKDALSANWLVGLTLSHSEYQTFSTDYVITPGIGITGKYFLSPQWALNGKAVAIIYSDGYSVPYQFGIEYPLKGLVLNFGLQGLISAVNSSGNSTVSNTYGLSIGLGI